MGAFRLPNSITRVFKVKFPVMGLKSTRVATAAFALFLVNAWMCREMFRIGFMQNLDSNEGAFVSMARFFRDFGFFERWFPWFNCGMPIENVYQPLLPMSVALLGRVSGWPLEQVFHFFMAVVYCVGPVTLFWFVFDWNRSAAAATAAALFYSLWSPAQWLIPILRTDGPLRLYNIVHYAEDPHNVALTLLPLALLFLRRRQLLPAVIFCSAVVLSNAFGAVDLAVGGVCIAVAQGSGWKRLALAGAAAYCLVSPWLPPSLILLMAHDQWGARGLLHSPLVAQGAAILLFGFTIRLTRPLQPFIRFAVLFAVVMCAIPVSFFQADITLVPQANRYQLELQLALAILCGSVARLPPRYAASILALLTVAGAAQAPGLRRAVRERIHPLNIAQTTEYKTNQWLNAHLHGERAMVAGDTEFLYNIFSNNPQLSGGHEPTVPNWSERVAIYAFYAGAPSPDDAVLWLKAFGARALTVPAGVPKFKGHLKPLWTDGSTTIFEVPHRGASMAYVVPETSLVKRQPIHSLDVEPLREYVRALETPSLPVATMHGGRITAHMRKSEAISVQINYAPGWKATVRGREVRVQPDAIGLISIRPDCKGDCEIDLNYGVSSEAWLCRALSLLAAGFLIATLLFADRHAGSGALPQPDPNRVSAG